MRALFLGDDGLELRDVPRPRPEAGEALVRVRRSGICATDLELLRGYRRFRGIPGHEFVGTVEEADERAWLGRRVVGRINVGCGRCRECLDHGAEHCAERRVVGIHGRDGAFAEYVTLPVANLLAVPDGLRDGEAVFAEPLAAALRIGEQVDLRGAERVAVLGPGKLGLLIAQTLAPRAGVTVLGRRRESLDLPRSWGLAVGLATEAPGNAFDLVVEATGNPSGLTEALRLVRARGTLVLKSTFEGPATLDLNRLVVAEVTVIGSRCGPFEPALDLLERGAIDVRSLVDAEYELERGLEAMAHAARPGTRKILLRPRAFRS